MTLPAHPQYRRIKAIIDTGAERNLLNLLAALCLMQFYAPAAPNDISTDHPRFWGSYALGLAQQMGLNIKSTKRSSHEGLRRRVWWTLYARDSIMSSAHGRPRIVNPADCGIEPPSIYDFPDPSDIRAQIFVSYVSITGIMCDLCQLLTRQNDPPSVEKNEVGLRLLDYVRSLPPALLLVQPNGIPRPYSFDLAQLHVHLLTTIIILYRPQSIFCIPSASSPAIVASNLSFRIFEAMELRGHTCSLSSGFAWHLLVTAIPQLSCLVIPSLREECKSNLDTLEGCFRTLASTRPSAANNLRNIQEIHRALESKEPLPKARLSANASMDAFSFSPLELFGPYGVDVPRNYDRITAALECSVDRALLGPQNIENVHHGNGNTSQMFYAQTQSFALTRNNIGDQPMLEGTPDFELLGMNKARMLRDEVKEYNSRVWGLKSYTLGTRLKIGLSWDRPGGLTTLGLINAFVRRALPDAPNGYAPEGGDCPSPEPSVRSANTLSPNETSWLLKRRPKANEALVGLLSRINISDFNAPDYLRNQTANISAWPNIAIAASGGGYRAMLNGAGAIAAFDSRTGGASADTGYLGGLLQSATYLSGLSGGSWLVGSLYMNNFTTIPALLSGDMGSVWNLENTIFEGPPTVSNYYKTLVDAVSDKENAGFNTSITDYWGRALSYQLINAVDGGISYTWSSLAVMPDFMDGAIPMPIVIADERAPGELLIRKLQQNATCVRGFDNSGFVMGTSSSLFNQAFLILNGTNDTSILANAITKVLAEINEDNNDVSLYSPNPFYRYNIDTNPNAESQTLFLVDGGEDLQNIPLHPLIQPARKVDVIFAIDSSADTKTNWPNGTSLVATYRRSVNSMFANGTTFPSIPDQNTFVNLGLNSRPTFFGCNLANMTGDAPLIVYLPNFPYSYASNVSTFDLQYNNTERNAIVQNGFDVATMANGTIDSEWPVCVGCAILSRSLERTGVAVPVACQDCFVRYCWNGTINDTSPPLYEPQMIQAQEGAKSEGTRLASEKATLLILSFFCWIFFSEVFAVGFDDPMNRV
ncbi:phospholipase A2 [Cladophialophora psammophila CBS 110553]|uniref:Lysophospholipase n=1 Tax=Cladophialophora psammophila CBS 110553 TaxID=1182543 RepID=W9VDQ7_9EURO|nr:phospholipase A2 [Cladophialophora psammophila CBS 110553]EXJ53608.1 phospholipase A2 [Cladophialophora psammophila CBS 110553]